VVALIIVLGFLVLITALVIAYFTSVSTERSVSKTFVSAPPPGCSPIPR